MGHGVHAVFAQKLLNTQRGVGRCAHKSPIMKWANALKESSKKNSLKPNTPAGALIQLDSYNTHLVEETGLQGAHPLEDNFIFGAPPHIRYPSISK